jgi:hypothetical protein
MTLRELPQPVRGVSARLGGDGPPRQNRRGMRELGKPLWGARVMAAGPGRNVSCLLTTQRRTAHLEFNDYVDSADGPKRG